MNKFFSAITDTLALLGSILVSILLILCPLSPLAFANELEDISQMAAQGKSTASMGKLNTYIESNPNSSDALFLKGVLLAELGYYNDAVKVFLDMTVKFPTLLEPYNNLAVLYASKGQYDKARKALETAIKTNPSYAIAHDNLGGIYAGMATKAYNNALQLDSSNTHTQTKLTLLKDLSGTGNKTTLENIQPTKALSVSRKSETEPAVIRKPQAVAVKTVVDIPKESDDKNLINSVNNWSKAWSDKNLDKYFASYSSNFKPAKGASRKLWESERRERISKPTKISVELSNVSIANVDSNKAKVNFKQLYRADKKPIYTTKTLIMSKSGNNWLIEEEIVPN
jgi:tetratricopeptide (TPR) repeat protein